MQEQGDQLLGQGLDQALKQLQVKVRSNPANPDLRIGLFELLAVQGQWGRAQTQLDIAVDLNSSIQKMVASYRPALQCEVFRQDVFLGKKSPTIFGEVEEWMSWSATALQLDSAGDHVHARNLRQQVLEVASDIPGSIDGQSFQWIMDADPRLGVMLEVIIGGQYFWMPFQRVIRIDIVPRGSLSDRVWVPAWFSLINGGKVPGLIPTRYSGSEAVKDVEIQVALATEWQEQPAETVAGIGHRQFGTDVGTFPLLNVGSIVLMPPHVNQEEKNG